MGDILSQEEVDALLSAITTGGPSESAPAPQEQATSAPVATVEEKDKSISKYDFRRPDIVSKDQMRTLQMLHKTFCRHLTTSLSTYLRSIIEVNLVAVDQLTYGEFNMSLSNPTCINVFSVKPLEGRAVLEVNPVLVFSIIDRLLGGAGEPPQVIRALTDIEQSIISRVIDLILEGLKEAWKNIIEFHFQVEEREVNPQFVQIVAPGETVILISCEMKVGQFSGIISICFPFVYIEPIMSQLSAQHWISSTQKKPTDEMKSSLKTHLNNTKLSVSATLGTANITIRQLLELKKSDVLVLNQKASKPLEINVEDKKLFHGMAGVLGKNRAVQLINAIKENIIKGDKNGK